MTEWTGTKSWEDKRLLSTKKPRIVAPPKPFVDHPSKPVNYHQCSWPLCYQKRICPLSLSLVRETAWPTTPRPPLLLQRNEELLVLHVEGSLITFLTKNEGNLTLPAISVAHQPGQQAAISTPSLSMFCASSLLTEEGRSNDELNNNSCAKGRMAYLARILVRALTPIYDMVSGPAEECSIFIA